MHRATKLRGSTAVRFFILGSLFVGFGLRHPPSGWLLVWCGLSFAGVGLTYAFDNPASFGKNVDGTIAWWAWIPFGPHFIFTWLSWQGTRLLAQEPCCAGIAPGLWLGRRPYASELPHGIDLVVDLTSEFRAAPGITDGRSYLCLPMLDGSAIEPHRFFELIEQIAAWKGGGIYIHCALGHGRSALVAAAVLIRKGLRPDAAQAFAAIRQARPKAGLNQAQEDLLADFAARAAPRRANP